MTSIGQREEMLRFVFRMQKESRTARRDSCKDTGRFWVLDRNGMENPHNIPMENRTPQPIKWYNDSKKPVMPCPKSVLWVVGSWKGRKWRNHTLEWRFIEHRILVPNYSFRESAQYVRIRGELMWTRRLDRNRRDEIIDLWTKLFWQAWSHTKYNFCYLLWKWHLETVCKKTFWASKRCPTKFISWSYMKTLGWNIVYQPGWCIKLDLTRTTVMATCSIMSRIPFGRKPFRTISGVFGIN